MIVVMMISSGIIPARAGFTEADGFRGRVAEDHPRSRGVYARPPHPPARRAGSSPLARGLLLPPRDGGFDHGIIPARAGFTQAGETRRTVGRDHPRSRGVYRPIADLVSVARGSSPLARGLHQAVNSVNHALRIIPARAGFTRPRPGAPSQRRDHPRSRGVYAMNGNTEAAWAGSSPLARGLLGEVRLLPRARGIIPARAGFTLTARGGESSACGSSPLARGLPPSPGARGAGRRIIPARAGFTGSSWAARSGTTDHPRSRGVYSACASRPADAARIIPARAGFTCFPGRRGYP